MLTMILGGLWHGAAWTFVLWGIYKGCSWSATGCSSRQIERILAPKDPMERVCWKAMCIFVTFHLGLLRLADLRVDVAEPGGRDALCDLQTPRRFRKRLTSCWSW